MFREAETHYKNGEFSEALALLEPRLDKDNVTLEELQLAGECAALLERKILAEDLFKRAIELSNNDPCSYYNLGVFYSHSGRVDEAFDCFSRCYNLKPSYLPAAEALSRMMRTAGWFKQAELVARNILKFHPQNVSAYSELGSILVATGKTQEGVEVYNRGIELDGSNLHIRSQALMAMNYSSIYSQKDIYEASLKWYDSFVSLNGEVNGKELAKLIPGFWQEDSNDVEKFSRSNIGSSLTRNEIEGIDGSIKNKRKIRIGYVSGDFRRHSVAYFIEPILFNHNRDKFEIFCYSYTTALDDVSERIIGMCDQWRDLVRIPSDLKRAEIMALDKLDIVVDLGGHTYDGLKALAYKPAKIQATYLGYPNTTGISAIDYRITDAIADPPEQDKFYSETLCRLNSGFLAFAPPLEVPEIKQPPCIENGYISFGSFNNYAKVNDDCVDMWCKILKRVENSRIIIKSKLFNDDGFKNDVYLDFSSRGVSTERVELQGYITSLYGHLDLYNRVDIALDTFPYNGTTTTCEALWMGVPVISLCGDDHRSRVGLSILTQIGLSSLVASNVREYMKLAIRLSEDFDKLTALRKSLRNALADSSVCDSITTTRELEDIYDSWL